MIRFLKSELKRMFTTKYCWILSAVLCAVTIATCIFCITDKSSNSAEIKNLYGVSEYNSFEDLTQNLKTTKQSLDAEINSLENEIVDGTLNDVRIATKKANIRNMQLSVAVMETLIANKVSFENVCAYQSTDSKNGASIAVILMAVAEFAVGLSCAVKIATQIPSERKDGQAKLTFLLPIGRIRYSAMRYLAALLKFVIVYAVFALFTTLCIVVFFNTTNYFVVAATANYCLLLSVPLAVLTVFACGLFFILCCSIVGYVFSLLCRNGVVALLCSLAVCLLGFLTEAIDNFVFGGLTFSKHLLPCVINIDKIWYMSDANPVWLSTVTALGELSPLVAIALTKFKLQDIR